MLRQEERELKAKQKAGALSDKEKERLEQLATAKDINVPFSVRWTEGSGQADIEIQGTKLTLKAGEWSEWVPVTFKVNALVKLHGMTQFHLIRARPRDPALREPGQPGPARPAHPDLQAGRLRGRPGEADRALPHAGLGGVGRQGAAGGPAGRGRVPLRLRARLRGPREAHPQEPRAHGLGPLRGRDRDHRPHLAHDVAAHRPAAPDVRPGAGREVRRLHREGLPPRRRPRRQASRPSCRRAPSSWSCPTTASTRSAAR